MKSKKETIWDLIKGNPALYPNLNIPANASDVNAAIECASKIELPDNFLNDYLGFVELLLGGADNIVALRCLETHENMSKSLSSKYAAISEEGNARVDTFGIVINGILADFYPLFLGNNRPSAKRLFAIFL